MLADFYFLAAAANLISMWMPNFYRAHSSYAPCAESHLNVAGLNIYHNSSGRVRCCRREAENFQSHSSCISSACRPGWHSLSHVISGNLLACFWLTDWLAGCNLLMARLVLAVLTFKPCRVCRDIELWRFVLFFWLNFYLAFAVKTQIYIGTKIKFVA